MPKYGPTLPAKKVLALSLTTKKTPTKAAATVLCLRVRLTFLRTLGRGWPPAGSRKSFK
ncbi:MAG: hypothetical protein ACT4PT_04770 [Methanobacteriota archaeon]